MKKVDSDDSKDDFRREWRQDRKKPIVIHLEDLISAIL